MGTQFGTRLRGLNVSWRFLSEMVRQSGWIPTADRLPRRSYPFEFIDQGRTAATPQWSRY